MTLRLPKGASQLRCPTRLSHLYKLKHGEMAAINATKVWSNRQLDNHVSASCTACLALVCVRIPIAVISQDSMMVGKPAVPAFYCGSSESECHSTS